MKALLKISLCFNLGLAGGLLYLLLASKPVAAPVSRTIAQVQPPVKEMLVAASPAPVLVAAKPFCWSQLDARDYHVYVNNLRAIGCPEPTVRAIVTADVNAVFRHYSSDLEHKLSDLAGASWSDQLANVDFERALKSRLQQLPGEQVAEIDDLLGLKPSPVKIAATLATAAQSRLVNQGSQGSTQSAANNSGSNPGGDSNPNATPNATTTDASGVTASALPPVASYQLPPVPKLAALPVIFQPLDPVAMNLNQSQVDAINNLRQQFVSTVGATSQNPNDPAYQQVWQQAQSQAEQQTITWLGYNPYMELWVKQYQSSLASQYSSAQ